jgi:hypothetical protein
MRLQKNARSQENTASWIFLVTGESIKRTLRTRERIRFKLKE